MDIRPKIISSCRAINSPGTLASGWQSLLAFVNDSCISVVDPNTGNLFQSLNLHVAPVIQVSWAPENYYHDAKNPFIHRLASADTSGRIVIWDVVKGSALAEATEPNSEAYAMHWISDQEISRDLLLVLYSENRLVLWNAQTCAPLWHKTFTFNLPTVIKSFCFDAFMSQSIILHGTTSFTLVSDFSLNRPPSNGMQLVFINTDTNNQSAEASGASRGRLKKAIKATAKAVIGDRLFGSSKSIKDAAQTNMNEVNTETPLQLLSHGYRKQHAIFVYSREILIYDLVLFQAVGAIKLESLAASFLQVYSCHFADILICLHATGSVSVYYCRPASRASPLSVEGRWQVDRLESAVDLTYVHACESKSLRRGRNFRVLAMTVDPARELTVTVATSDGRLQFLTLERKAPKGLAKEKNVNAKGEEDDDVWPTWTLTDLIASINPAEICESLRLHLKGIYSGSSPVPTVCSVCPAHFLLPIADSLLHNSLIAIGTMRGSVQIWDMHTSKLWREYQLLSVPVRGLAWGTKPRAISSDKEHQPVHGLSLFAYGWQSSENGLQNVMTVTGNVKNFVVALDLTTGQQQQIYTNRADDHELHVLKLALQKGQNSAIKHGQWWNVTSEMTEYAMSAVTPIRIMRVSNLGQYLSILFENWPLEIWDARKLVLLKSFPQDSSRPVALAWSTINPQRTTSTSSDSVSQGSSSHKQDDDQQESTAHSPLLEDNSADEEYIRETFILCTSPISLKLFTMEGIDMDSMPISNTIVNSLPAPSRGNITCTAWRSPMVAFGMSDGCIAVRNLQTKSTVVRYMSILVNEASGPLAGNSLFGSSEQSNSNSLPSASSVGTDHAVTHTSSGALIVNPHGTSANIHQAYGLTKLEFLKTSGPISRLLALCTGAVAVWEPQNMILVCVARFGNSPQKALIDAAWSSVIPTGDSCAAPTCALLALDGSLRLAKAGTADANQKLIENQELSTHSVQEYSPTSSFEFGSPFSFDELQLNGLSLIPSVLPVKVFLNLQHLLQHQPWRKTTSPSSEDLLKDCVDKVEVPSSAVHFSLSCPSLSMGFNDVVSSVNGFMSKLKKQKQLCRAFESPKLSIAERCLLTALVFGDSYETAFWRLANYRLLACDKEGNRISPPHDGRRKRRFDLDIVWDTMADQDVYRSAVIERVNRLVQESTTADQNKLCSQYLLMLGFQKAAISHLAETQPTSPDLNLNIHRACLLAANVYIQNLEQEGNTHAESSARMAYTSSVKLLSTNLISNNKLHEGVELLCILGMHLDACRYLETYNEWGTAIWLAKCTLSKEESEEVMRRWALHLASSAGKKTLAVLVLVYLGQHDVVLNLLHSLQQHNLATRYLEACLECGMITRDSKSEKLHSQIFLEFARIMMSLGHKDAAIYYANLAGKLGEALREEVDFLLN